MRKGWENLSKEMMRRISGGTRSGAQYNHHPYCTPSPPILFISFTCYHYLIVYLEVGTIKLRYIHN